jgi:hypothetical protein
LLPASSRKLWQASFVRQQPAANSQQLSSALTLLVFRVLANHPHHTLAVDDLALVADFLYRCSDFHKPSFQLSAISLQQSYL